MACGWAHYLLRPPLHTFSLGLLAGLGVAAGAIQMGLRMESNRIASNGSGTPRSSMARRLTIFFLLLTLIVAGLMAARVFALLPALAAMGAFSGVWIPAAIGGRLAPEAGPLAPLPSVAARGSFFGMAVGSISAVASPWLLASAPGAGFLTGVWGSAALLLAAAWLAAARAKPL